MRLALIPLLLLAGSAAADSHRNDRNDLAAQLAGRVAGSPQDCVSMDTTTTLRPVDSKTLVLDHGMTFYVNHLRGSCPGIEPTDTIIYEANGSQYCRGDHFRTKPFGGSVVPGPICVLGEFVPYRRPVH